MNILLMFFNSLFWRVVYRQFMIIRVIPIISEDLDSNTKLDMSGFQNNRHKLKESNITAWL